MLMNATERRAMQAGKTYKASWTILGCPRTAYFKCMHMTKGGNAQGLYLDAGATKWVRHTVKAEHFQRYTEV
jgi:hypothetical protein